MEKDHIRAILARAARAQGDIANEAAAILEERPLEALDSVAAMMETGRAAGRVGGKDGSRHRAQLLRVAAWALLAILAIDREVGL